MIYKISKLTVLSTGNKWNNSYYFEDLGKAMDALKELAKIELEEHNFNGIVKESWLDLYEMIPNNNISDGFWDGELFIREDPIAFQYIDPDSFSEDGKDYVRQGF